MNALTVGITGINGYLGSHLARALIAGGHKVVGLCRKKPHGLDALRSIPFTLGETPPASQFEGIDVLVHAAYDFSGRNREEVFAKNVSVLDPLFLAAKNGGVKKIILISSMAAFTNCHSIYGNAKLAGEKIASLYGAWSIRPGFIYGGEHEGGLARTLRKVATTLPVIPTIGWGDQILHTVHIDDLNNILMAIAESTSTPSIAPVTVACRTPYPFKKILTAFANTRNKTPLFIPIPPLAIFLPLKLLEKLGLKLPVRSDSLVSLLATNPSPDFELPAGIHCSIRTL